jgi:glycosyltransferase involved in cell wall biosynthesis
MLRIGVIMYQTSETKGQELVAQRMVKEFRRQGHDAFLITSIFHDWVPAIDIDEAKKRGGHVLLFDRTLGIPVIRVNSGAASWPPRRVSFVDFMGVLTRLVEELDLNVLITHSTLWNGPEEVVKFVHWRYQLVEGGAPNHAVVYAHMNHLQEPSEERYAIQERSYREAWNKVTMPQILAAADVVLVTTPFETQFMKRTGADEDKLLLFPGGVDDESLSLLGNAGQFRATHGLPSGAALVSFLGTIEERKNAGSILEVAKRLKEVKNLHFVLAGRLEGEYAQKVREEAESLDNVSVLGPLPEEDKVGLIKASWLNINLSRSEALGISQLEFMALGVPVVTSGVGGQSWIVNGGHNGVLLNGPDDVEGAASAINKLVSHKSLRNKLGKNAARFAGEYTIAFLVRKLAKRLESELRARSEQNPSDLRMTSEERVLDAWVSKGQKVAVTSNRLVIRSAKSTKEVVSIPYDEIVRVATFIKAPWALLVAGLAATVVLLGQRIVGLGLISHFQPEIMTAMTALGHPGLTQQIVTLLPLLPFAISGAGFAAGLSKGYVVMFGTAGKVFLPKEFRKALRFADKMTPKDLLDQPIE